MGQGAGSSGGGGGSGNCVLCVEVLAFVRAVHRFARFPQLFHTSLDVFIPSDNLLLIPSHSPSCSKSINIPFYSWLG